MNNPVQLVQMMRNPQMMMQAIMSNKQIISNPIAQNAIKMYQNGDTDGLSKLADNLCKEKGIDLNEAITALKGQLGI